MCLILQFAWKSVRRGDQPGRTASRIQLLRSTQYSFLNYLHFTYDETDHVWPENPRIRVNYLDELPIIPVKLHASFDSSSE